MKTLELKRAAVGLRGTYLASLLLILGCDTVTTIRGRVYGTDNSALNGFRIVSQGQTGVMDLLEMWPLEGVTFNVYDLLTSAEFEEQIICDHFSYVGG